MELVPVSKDLPILNKVPVDKGIINNSSSLLQGKPPSNYMLRLS